MLYVILKYMSIEERIKKLENLVDDLITENEGLTERIDELEDDHITLLLSNCFCNANGWGNGSCEALMHYCQCRKLQKKSYDCRSNNHACICLYEVIDGKEVIKKVEWCKEHKNELEDNIIKDNIIQDTKDKVIKKFNPMTFMRHFLARIKNK